MVRVVLVDARTGEVLTRAEQRPEELPETFAISTRLTLGGREWVVRRADPVTRVEAAARGELRLELVPVERVDPRKLLFSLPTIESELPPLIAGDPAEALDLHEDDWRQIELVERRFAPIVAAELDAIRAIFAERQGLGFPNTHLRKQIPAPLDRDTHEIMIPGPRCPLAINGSLVEGGFAVGTSREHAIYGRAVGHKLVALCALDGGDPLRALADRHDLLVVSWCRPD